jgi:hypothetical protein
VTTQRIAACALAAALAGAILGACGNDAVGVDACKQVESARCRQAPACGIALEPPFHTAGGDIDGCIRFYQTACLHGLAVGNPGGSAVNACVAAIETGDCNIVRVPQTSPQCAWLAPVAPAPVADAAAPVDATGDATSDAADGADATGE